MDVNLARLRKPHRKVPDLNTVWREEWNAQAPIETSSLALPVKNVLLTYTETDPCKTDEACLKAVQDLQRDQMTAGAKDIHWNFLVGGNGKVYEGRGWVANAQKAPKYSNLEGTSFDIAYIGNDRKHVTEKMKFVKGQLIRLGLIEYVIRDTFYFYEDKVDETVMKIDDGGNKKKMNRKERRKEERKNMNRKRKKRKDSDETSDDDDDSYSDSDSSST